MNCERDSRLFNLIDPVLSINYYYLSQCRSMLCVYTINNVCWLLLSLVHSVSKYFDRRIIDRATWRPTFFVLFAERRRSSSEFFFVIEKISPLYCSLHLWIIQIRRREWIEGQFNSNSVICSLSFSQNDEKNIFFDIIPYRFFHRWILFFLQHFYNSTET